MTANLAALRPLLDGVGDAKRIRVAGTPRSLAEQAFGRAWARLTAGEDVKAVALSEAAAAVARVRLAGIDGPVLQTAGLTAGEARDVLLRGFDEVAGPLAEDFRPELRECLALALPMPQPPDLVARLVTQPRAGATAPGKQRIIVEPPESHGDHCLTVAVYAVLIAPAFGADPVAPFLAGLAHHLPNILLPDAGYAGEVLLGPAYDRMLASLEERELAALPDDLADQIRVALHLRSDTDAPESKAFHAADVLDRVLQVHHHAIAAAFTAEQALDDLEIVHAGAVQGFQLKVLTAAGL